MSPTVLYALSAAVGGLAWLAVIGLCLFAFVLVARVLEKAEFRFRSIDLPARDPKDWTL